MTKKLFAEFLGTLILLATVIGSGIMADALSGGNDAVALLGNTLATGAILIVIILMFGNVSGAHFNPAVTITFLLRGELSAATAGLYIGAQIIGGLAGMMLAHAMFDLPLIQESQNIRASMGISISEVVATYGLVATILFTLKSKPDAVPYAVGLYITAAYWFTASTSFANPAVTIARSFTNTFSGVAPENVMHFIAAQLVGATLAWFTAKMMDV